MTRLDQLRRMLDDHRAGFAVDADADPWELVEELIDIADAQLARLRLVPGDLWSVFAETAAEHAQADCHDGDRGNPTPEPTP